MTATRVAKKSHEVVPQARAGIVKVMSDPGRSKRRTARVRVQAEACGRRHVIGCDQRECDIRKKRSHQPNGCRGAKRHQGTLVNRLFARHVLTVTTARHSSGNRRFGRIYAQRERAPCRHNRYRQGNKKDQYGTSAEHGPPCAPNIARPAFSLKRGYLAYFRFAPIQRPKAHITAQGRRERRSGATPTAVNQLQLKASPPTTATAATASHNLQSLRIERLRTSQHIRVAFSTVELTVACVMCVLS